MPSKKASATCHYPSRLQGMQAPIIYQQTERHVIYYSIVVDLGKMKIPRRGFRTLLTWQGCAADHDWTYTQ